MTREERTALLFLIALMYRSLTPATSASSRAVTREVSPEYGPKSRVRSSPPLRRDHVLGQTRLPQAGATPY